METKFNFNSAICTSIEQSRKLLALGLKKETADMHHWESEGKIYTYVGQMGDPNGIPAWSLHRIWVLMPKWIDIDKRRYYLQMNAKGDIGYFSDNYHILEYFYGNETIYDNYISCIEWLIKEGYFNKEYLV